MTCVVTFVVIFYVHCNYSVYPVNLDFHAKVYQCRVCVCDNVYILNIVRSCKSLLKTTELGSHGSILDFRN